MIRPFTISARTFHQLESIESKESCRLTAPRMASDYKGVAHLSSQWAVPNQKPPHHQLCGRERYQLSSQWRYTIVIQNP